MPITDALPVVYAALTRTVRWGSVDTGSYMIMLTDSRTFIARTKPKLYDAAGKRMTLDELPLGSIARIKYVERDGLRWFVAVQVLEVKDDQPFG